MIKRVSSVLEIGILGPLTIRRDGEGVEIPGTRRRTVLARLVVADGRSVMPEALIEDVWEGDPPSRALSTLQSHISFLRKALGSEVIRLAAGGYRLDFKQVEVDARQVEQELSEARAAVAGGKDPVLAEQLFARALRRWRGPVLGDVSGAMWAIPEISRFEEMRLAAIEDRHEALLAQGRHSEVVAMCEAAVAESPLCE